jgi:hypothetical protein
MVAYLQTEGGKIEDGAGRTWGKFRNRNNIRGVPIGECVRTPTSTPVSEPVISSGGIRTARLSLNDAGSTTPGSTLPLTLLCNQRGLDEHASACDNSTWLNLLRVFN